MASYRDDKYLNPANVGSGLGQKTRDFLSPYYKELKREATLHRDQFFEDVSNIPRDADRFYRANLEPLGKAVGSNMSAMVRQTMGERRENMRQAQGQSLVNRPSTVGQPLGQPEEFTGPVNYVGPPERLKMKPGDRRGETPAPPGLGDNLATNVRYGEQDFTRIGNEFIGRGIRQEGERGMPSMVDRLAAFRQARGFQKPNIEEPAMPSYDPYATRRDLRNALVDSGTLTHDGTRWVRGIDKDRLGAHLAGNPNLQHLEYAKLGQDAANARNKQRLDMRNQDMQYDLGRQKLGSDERRADVKMKADMYGHRAGLMGDYADANVKQQRLDFDMDQKALENYKDSISDAAMVLIDGKPTVDPRRAQTLTRILNTSGLPTATGNPAQDRSNTQMAIDLFQQLGPAVQEGRGIRDSIFGSFIAKYVPFVRANGSMPGDIQTIRAFGEKYPDLIKAGGARDADEFYEIVFGARPNEGRIQQ